MQLQEDGIELAAKNATEHDIEVIQERYKELERSIGDDSEWVKADFEFHKSILVASHNELMLSLVQTLRLALERSRHTTIEFIKQHPSPA